jgi:hypothetical protein
MNRRQLFIRAAKLQKFPQNDRATLLKPLHSSFRESRVQSSSSSLTHHSGTLREIIVTAYKREANPCEFRKEANGSRIGMEERVMVYTPST